MLQNLILGHESGDWFTLSKLFNLKIANLWT